MLAACSIAVFASILVALRYCKFEWLFAIIFAFVFDSWCYHIANKPGTYKDHRWYLTPGSGYVCLMKYGARPPKEKVEDIYVDPTTHPDLRPLTPEEFRQLEDTLKAENAARIPHT